MCYDKDIDKYKCGPAVTMISDVASPNAESTSSVLLLIYSWYYDIRIYTHSRSSLLISRTSYNVHMYSQGGFGREGGWTSMHT